jgi:hypothetical protein
MRRLAGALAGLAVVGGCSEALSAEMSVVAPQNSWTVTVASEVRYYSWRGNRGSPTTVNTAPGSGSELYIPFAAQLTGNPTDDFKVQFLARGGWVHATQSTGGLTGSVDTFIDTVASGTITYLGINGVQPFAALSANLPTGKSALFGTAANARMDPDLVEVGTFGEGWNVGPSVGFNLPLNRSLMLTASVGYTWRYSFERERSTAQPDPTVQAATSVDPGDVLTVTAGIGYQAGPWTVKLTGSWSEETTTQENGADLFQAGSRYFGSATLSYRWPEAWGQTTVNASAAHWNRNKVLYLGASALVTEAFNTNSDLYRVYAQHLFLVGRNFAFGPTGSYLQRNHNSYDPGTLQFVPAKERWAAGMLARYAVNNRVTFNLRAEHVWTRELERIAPGGLQFSVLANAFVAALAVPVVSSTGWILSGGVNVKF